MICICHVCIWTFPGGGRLELVPCLALFPRGPNPGADRDFVPRCCESSWPEFGLAFDGALFGVGTDVQERLLLCRLEWLTFPGGGRKNFGALTTQVHLDVAQDRLPVESFPGGAFCMRWQPDGGLPGGNVRALLVHCLLQLPRHTAGNHASHSPTFRQNDSR